MFYENDLSVILGNHLSIYEPLIYLRLGLEPSCIMFYYACLKSNWVTTKGRHHGPTACQPLPNEEILLKASELAGLNSTLLLLCLEPSRKAVNLYIDKDIISQ